MPLCSRTVISLLSGLFLLTIAIAVLNIMVPLWLTHEHYSVAQIGMISSGYFVGNLIGAVVAGPLIRYCGFRQSYLLATLLFAIATLLLISSATFVSWGVCRLLAGISCAMIWVVVESALLNSGTLAQRGRLLAAYMIIYYSGTVLGQLLPARLSGSVIQLIPWILLFILCAVLPLSFMRLAAYQTVSSAPATALHRLLRYQATRLGIAGCLVAGVILGVVYGLMPLYLAHKGMSDGQVGCWMALLVSTGVAVQWPIGWLADRYGRRVVLRVQVIMVILASALLLDSRLLVPAWLLLGGASFTLYPVVLSLACEKAHQAELVMINQTLLLTYTLGSLLGPLITALLMEKCSDQALFMVIGGMALSYLIMLCGADRDQPESHPACPV